MKDRFKFSNTAIRAFAIWAGVILGIGFFAVLIGAGAEIAYARMHENQIFPGVRILNIRVDGLTKDEARQTIQKAVDDVLGKGLSFYFRNTEVKLDTATASKDPDASRDMILYNIDKAVDQAYEIGRGSGWKKDILDQISARARLVRITGEVVIDEKNINDALLQAFRTALVPAMDAEFSFHFATGTAPLVGIENEKTGFSFVTEKAFKELRNQAEHLDFKRITLQEEKIEPKIRRMDLEPLIGEAEAILKRPSLTFTYEEKQYAIPAPVLATWITAVEKDGQLKLALSPQKFLASLRELAPGIEQEAKNGSLDIEDGKIVSFKAGTEGIAFNAEKTLSAVNADWPKKTSFPIITDVTFGSLLGEDPERLGIKEIIGVGKSNFSGSPSNRRKNIKKGADKVNGSIIAPGEEFSLLKTLGEIDGANGWYPELVIKGDKTLPEFGGGLCQIGTTTFRGALNSGLKITERRAHSYRVRYYEPAGTDATIYDPSPDFKFVNDTKNHVLINAYIVGDNAIFEFWGTKDGRVVDPIKPRIYNITSPPATKYIETTDLAPGKKNCTESAHPGADAEIIYKITYADGTVHSEVFQSHYRAWQAVCLIGVEKLTETTEVPAN